MTEKDSKQVVEEAPKPVKLITDQYLEKYAQDFVSKEQIVELLQKFEAVKEESRDFKKDFITTFGIFASFIAFFSIEVQVFKEIQRFSLIIGFSLFLLAAFNLFLLNIHNIFREKNSWRSYFSPTSIISLILLGAAGYCFYWAMILHPR